MSKKRLFHLMLIVLDVPLIAGLWLGIMHFNNQESGLVLGVVLMLGSGLATVALIRWYKKQGTP